MKRLIIFLLGIFLILPAIAADEVTMVSYEQKALDFEGKLALKNNTKETVLNVAFRITYFDMSGNQLDYEDFSEKVEIAPGLTKKVAIRAYERGRDYYYYKDKEVYSDGKPFKIKFQLLSYNDKNIKGSGYEDGYSDDYEIMEDDDYSSGPSKAMIFFMIVFVLVAIGITIGLYVLVAVLAKNRHRNVVIWILLSILATPLLMAIILLVIGDSEIENINEIK